MAGMRIGIVGTRLAGVDGVTFEAAKWETVLLGLGHEVRLCAGELDALRSNARLIPAMHFAHPPAARVTAAAFDKFRLRLPARIGIRRRISGANVSSSSCGSPLVSGPNKNASPARNAAS